METPALVVITPVKNEAWILPRFLATTTAWADLVIIADQSSSDDSVAICRSFEKVVVIDNQSASYDEATRQQLLIREARARFPGPRILVALDADEILAADAIGSQGWQDMLNAAPGTVLMFEKPDLYPSPSHCIRYPIPWPLAYCDDGREHQPKTVHSIRIPAPLDAPRLTFGDIKILHYACTRPNGQRAKFRFYSVIENVLKTQPLHRRLRGYGGRKELMPGARIVPSPAEWFSGWEKRGIDMTSIVDPPFHWHDFEVLAFFAKFGERQFWLEDIWDFDWETCRQAAIASGFQGAPRSPIYPPPMWAGFARGMIRLSIRIFDSMRKLPTTLRKKDSTTSTAPALSGNRRPAT